MNRRTFVYQAALGTLQLGLLSKVPHQPAATEYKGLRCIRQGMAL